MIEYQNPLKEDDVRQICYNNGLEIHDHQWNLLKKWVFLLQDLNQKANLISRKETNFLWEKQILSCLTLLILRKFNQNSEICDFGTGGGLPGILMAIVRPDLKLTLFESRKKKVKFVQEMIETLKISNVQIILGRGEELGKKSLFFHRFPFVTSRSVASMVDIVRWTSDLRKPESVLHIFKGGEFIDEEFALLEKFSGFRINKSSMNLKGYSRFVDNQKFIISLEFYPD